MIQIYCDVCSSLFCLGSNGFKLKDGRIICRVCLKVEPLSVRFGLVEVELKKLRDMIFKLFRIDKIVNWLSNKLKS